VILGMDDAGIKLVVAQINVGGAAFAPHFGG
jgi:hypothetical protein